MTEALSRRDFVRTSLLATGVWALAKPAPATSEALAFQVSLNELSLQRTLTSRRMDHLDLAKWAKEQFGISAIEYVSRFFRQRAHDETYLMEMNKRAADHNVRQLLIMIEWHVNFSNYFSRLELCKVSGVFAVACRVSVGVFYVGARNGRADRQRHAWPLPSTRHRTKPLSGC